MPKKIKIFKIILYIIFILNICSCGFQVVHKDQNISSSISHELAGIKIKKNRTLLSQQLRGNIYEAINPDQIITNTKYFLILDIKNSISSTYITTTGASGRNKIIINVNYELRNAENMQKITNGTVEISDNYDVSSNRFGTYVAQNYVENNLTKLIAANLRNLLVNDIVEFQKRCLNIKNKEAEEICIFSDN